MNLRLRAVLGPLLFALVPIVASAIFVGEITKAAQRVSEGEVARLAAPLEKAAGAYRDAVLAHKEAFRQATAALAAHPSLRELCRQGNTPEVGHAAAAALLADAPGLVELRLRVSGSDRVLAQATRRGLVEGRTLELKRPLVEAPGCELLLTFATPPHLQADFEALGSALQAHRQRGAIRVALPGGYRFAFLGLVGALTALTAGVAIWLTSRTSRRIDRLVAATRRVGEGDLEASSSLGGQDELADLSRAFDQMVADLRRSRDEIEYLQKIGAWQEVARRLAHEIKNPLTPIQLAVQQIHTKYEGDDPRYRKLLDDAAGIVTEEIAALRRLVDTFHRFSRLPRVEPRPLELGVVADDIARELDVELLPPGGPVTVAADRQLLRGALVNLVENARQAGARRVQLSWRADAEGRRAFLEVADDGPGIAAELAPRIFDPYVTTKDHGTGLGLAIVKKTLLEHGGDVWIAASPPSEAVGSASPSPWTGARFVLELPTAASVAESDPSSRASAS